MSFFDKGEGGEEGQQRQCSMDEEITQGTGGKYCCVSLPVWMCICALCHAFVCLCILEVWFTCACLSERFYRLRFCISSIAYVQARSKKKKEFSPPPDTAVPITEIEKEEEESSSQAQTPAEESTVKVRPVFNPPVQTATPSSDARFCLTIYPPPCLPVSRCPSALKFTPSTPM